VEYAALHHNEKNKKKKEEKKEEKGEFLLYARTTAVRLSYGHALLSTAWLDIMVLYTVLYVSLTVLRSIKHPTTTYYTYPCVYGPPYSKLHAFPT
jgi:hypothetical protein